MPSGQSLVSCIVGRACKPVNSGGAVMDLRRSCGVVDDSRGTNLGGGRPGVCFGSGEVGV